MADDNLNKYSREEANNANSIAQSARSLTEELKDQLGIRSRLNETQKETLNIARSLQRSAQENTVEIGNSGNIERQIAKDTKIRLSITRELKDLIKEANKSGSDSIKNSDKILTYTKQIQELEEEKVGKSKAYQASLDKQILGIEKLLFNSKLVADKDAQRIALLKGMASVSDELIIQRNKEAEIQKDINDKMGVTGALVKGTGALMERLGMRSGIFQDAMKESAQAMKDMAEETVRGDANFTKMEIMLKGFSKLASGFGKALFDPFTLITAIVSKFFELNKASTKLQQLTGQNAGIQAAHNNSLASGAQVMTLMAEMTERTGVAAQAMFSPDDLGRLAEAQNLLGLSAEQASNLGMFSKTSGTSIQGYKEELVESVNNFNAMNDSAVAHGVVMKDVLNASADVAMSLNGNPGRIAKAAAAARKLGLDLAKVNQIADGLMDFETSIGNELEAQLLTGKQINLSKARELALNNDLEGVAEELAKNGASAAEFANMNRIQQEAMAKAMGMNREEMGKMLINQKGMNNLSAEQRAKMRGVTLEQLEQMEAAESLKLAFSKIAEPIASILNLFTPFITMLAKAVSFVAPIAPYVIAIVGAFRLLNDGAFKIATNFGKMTKNAKSFLKSIVSFKPKEFISGLNKSFGMGANIVKDARLPSGYRDKKTGQAVSKKIGDSVFGGDKAKKIADSSKATERVTPGKNIKTFLNNLAQGLKSMAGTKVLQGALNLIPASLGLVAMIPGVAGAKLMELISGPKLLISMQSLAQGLTAMGKGNVLLGTLGLTAAALAFTLMIPASAGMALLGLTAPMAAAGIFALIPALVALGSAMASGVGALGLAALIGLAVGAGAAFALVGAGAMMMGKGIQFAAEGFTSLIGGLIQLTGVVPQLLLVGGALMSIAAGLGAIAIAGIAAIPALAALSTFALVVTPLATVAGDLFGGEGGEDNSMAEISAKLDKLISVVSAGGDVILDGNKVGNALVLGSYKSS